MKVKNKDVRSISQHCNANILHEDKQKGHTGQDDTASGVEVLDIAVHRTEVDEGHVENGEELPE